MTKQANMIRFKPGGQYQQVGSGGTFNVHSSATWSRSGTTITATAAEINILDDVTATYLEINTLDAALAATSSFTPVPATTAAGKVIGFALQLIDGNSAEMAVRSAVTAYFSRDINGDTLITTAPKSLVINADGLLLPYEATTSRIFGLVSEADGDVAINVSYEALTAYLAVIMPDGRIRMATTGAVWS